MSTDGCSSEEVDRRSLSGYIREVEESRGLIRQI